MSDTPDVIGVVGAGTMGAGIAQLAAATGARTLLHDPVPEALDRGLAYAADGLERWRAKGRLEREPGPIEGVADVSVMATARLIIEAAPERLELKRELFGALSEIAPTAVLASNTSSIPITALASAAADPGRVVGMHFFNPPPVMRLLEVIAGIDSAPDALALARATGRAMGKRVIDATDGPGFLVNRCNRPFGLEALKLLQERVASVEEIDAIVRAAGFRMGPFELQDLVGIDTGFEVSRSFHELSFGEPRWRPSPLAARMVAAGRLGRKSGRGWYSYPRASAEEPPVREPGGGDGRLVVVAGELEVADGLRALAARAGFDTRDQDEADGEVPWLLVDCGADPDLPPLQGGPVALLCADGSLHALDAGGAAVGFHALPPLDSVGVVELTRGPGTADLAARRAEELIAALGKRTAWVADAPGLVLGRIVAQLVNEACFAVSEGVGSREDVDDGMVLGLNHPRGPFAWCEAMGAPHVLAILDGLRLELGEERYRASPFLRRSLT
ncbi:MAG TPA: 3-hydroxyacyl-CoA dehydrogenase NAD-binding domain-containing protein [Solirubrobacteraceae bacterium]|nr:3-hydroxyacyl-CoA dehydrogenase NAD-binding domain-containing protein [Solirubrobacteraceae bacterium]